jgi:DNA polymerase I-like protein with 3'-5' exonuclease and polymerase domains
MKFLTQNLEIHTFNSKLHGFNIIYKLQLYKLSPTLTIHQKGAYYDRVKIFNKLPKYTSGSDFR